MKLPFGSTLWKWPDPPHPPATSMNLRSLLTMSSLLYFIKTFSVSRSLITMEPSETVTRKLFLIALNSSYVVITSAWPWAGHWFFDRITERVPDQPPRTISHFLSSWPSVALYKVIKSFFNHIQGRIMWSVN